MHEPKWSSTSKATRRVFERAIGRIEHDSRLDRPAVAAGHLSDRVNGSGAGQWLRGDWLGHAAHPLLTDLPIGCWTSAALLDVLAGKQGRPASQRLIGLGLAFVPAAALTGMADYGAVSGTGARRTGVVHGVGNVVGSLLYLASWRQRRRGNHLRGVVVGMAGGAVMSFTGYLGGHLAFARGAGVGARGTMPRVQESADRGGTTVESDLGDGLWGDLLGIDEIADLLAVGVDEVHVMVADGVLTPVGGSDGVRFSIAEVLASRVERD